jgi:CelD/BcsL family acetyltransferase involved in cellulose biosynthesis
MTATVAGSCSGALTMGVCSDEASLHRLGASWNALLAQTQDPTVFQTWEWVSTWWKHHGRGRPYVLVARQGNEVVGLLPLVMTRYRGSPIRQLRFMSAPLADVQNLIVHRDHEPACAGLFLRALGDMPGWDLADLADVPERSALGEVTAPDSLAFGRSQHRICPYIALPQTWDAFAHSLQPKMRKRTAYYRRRLKRELQAVHETVGEAAREETMHDLFALHSQRWRKRGVGGAFSTPQTRALHLELSRQLLARGDLRLHRLRIRGRTAAVLYCFHHARRVSYYLSGFDLAFAKYSIGHDLVAYAIEDAIGLGATEFDFLRGDEAYKYGWRAAERSTVRLVFGRRTLRSRIALRLHAFERFVEHKGLAAQRRLWGHQRPTAV